MQAIEEIHRRLEEPPPALALEAVLYHFQTRIRDRAKYRGNSDVNNRALTLQFDVSEYH